jgi:hypothetical protein
MLWYVVHFVANQRSRSKDDGDWFHRVKWEPGAGGLL